MVKRSIRKRGGTSTGFALLLLKEIGSGCIVGAGCELEKLIKLLLPAIRLLPVPRYQ